jgi:hypothetical protein
MAQFKQSQDGTVKELGRLLRLGNQERSSSDGKDDDLGEDDECSDVSLIPKHATYLGGDAPHSGLSMTPLALSRILRAAYALS